MYHFGQQLRLMPKPKLFIVEGCDATGKSTLAKHLAQKLGAAYFHSSAKGALKVAQKDYLFNILDSVEQTMYGSNLPVVLDRHYLSEMCYAPVMRPRGQPILAGEIVSINKSLVPTGEMFARIQQLNPIYIVCLSDKALENHRENVDKDHPYSDAQYVAIYNNYIKVVRQFVNDSIPVHVYDIAQWDKNVEGFIEKLLHETSQA